jgi:hypothetical protein
MPSSSNNAFVVGNTICFRLNDMHELYIFLNLLLLTFKGYPPENNFPLYVKTQRKVVSDFPGFAAENPALPQKKNIPDGFKTP